MIGDNFLWTEKYRPKTVKECILPDSLKKTFQQFVDQKSIPNLLLSGLSGVGKTSIARAMCEEIQCDYLIINGSMSGNIDTLRNEILQFASTVSLQGGRKYVILDEADYLNQQSTMPALRNFMEEFAKNCGFILTCNFRNRIIDALQSRCSVVDFSLSKKESNTCALEFLGRVEEILTIEKIKFDKKAIAAFIVRYFPDWRRILNELQRYSSLGNIDTGILVNTLQESYSKLLVFLKAKDFVSIRRWVAENDNVDTIQIFRQLYQTSTEFLKTESVPQLVLILARYQYQAAFVADHQINLTACMVEIMTDCVFK